MAVSIAFLGERDSRRLQIVMGDEPATLADVIRVAEAVCQWSTVAPDETAVETFIRNSPNFCAVIHGRPQPHEIRMVFNALSDSLMAEITESLGKSLGNINKGTKKC